MKFSVDENLRTSHPVIGLRSHGGWTRSVRNPNGLSSDTEAETDWAYKISDSLFYVRQRLQLN